MTRKDHTTVQLRGLRVTAVHGLLDEERVRPQPFEIDIDLTGDFSQAVAHDDLDGTVDYASAVEAAVAVACGRPHLLLESLAGAIADAVLGVDNRELVVEVAVTVTKLRPPVPHDLAAAAVRLVRSRA